MKKKRVAYRVLVRKAGEKDLRENERIILKWTFK
jgi:hypothetical protein